jgi:hypothetical protein
MYFQKDALQNVIGKTIRSVVFRSGRNVNPEVQLFLVFEDGTYFELYGQEIDFARTLSKGNATEAINYASKFSSELFVVSGSDPFLEEQPVV